jgi:hypothetical protein
MCPMHEYTRREKIWTLRILVPAMILSSLAALWILSSARPLPAQQTTSRLPWSNGESLRYQLLWPSSLVLGDASFETVEEGENLRLTATVEVRLPQYAIRFTYNSLTTRELCSIRFQQRMQSGSKRREETLEFDAVQQMARRIWDGQTREFSTSRCPRDPLAALYYFRRQLSGGKPVDAFTVFLDHEIQLRIEKLGSGEIALEGLMVPAEHFRGFYSGSRGEKSFEFWTRTDSSRALLRVFIPFPLATFSADLQ